MGRPPCCDKLGVKKGPWTPEEDIILVTYINDHGPGNWRAVPTNSGLMRCSKSCRLRWTNYLRPGIKRGNFTDQEEKLIIHLQALLGNRWAAISSYLPERTDNDIKNYWNTHLMKKVRKLQSGGNEDQTSSETSTYNPISKGQWERRLQTDINMAKRALSEALSLEKPNCQSDLKASTSGSGYYCYTKPSQPQQAAATTYASSTENISRLLEGWMREDSQKPGRASRANSLSTQQSFNNAVGRSDSLSSENGATNNGNTVSPESLESIFQFDSSTPEVSETSLFQEESKESSEAQVPVSLIENWLFDESAGHGEHEDLIDMQLDDTADQLF